MTTKIAKIIAQESISNKQKNNEMDSLKAASGVSQCIGCLCSLGCCAAQITLIVYLGIFAFNNPDNEAWYGVDAEGKSQLFA